MNDTALASARWRTSSYSGNSGNCVEVAAAPAVVGVRDSKYRDGGALELTSTAWAHFRMSLAS